MRTKVNWDLSLFTRLRSLIYTIAVEIIREDVAVRRLASCDDCKVVLQLSKVKLNINQATRLVIEIRIGLEKSVRLLEAFIVGNPLERVNNTKSLEIKRFALKSLIVVSLSIRTSLSAHCADIPLLFFIAPRSIPSPARQFVLIVHKQDASQEKG